MISKVRDYINNNTVYTAEIVVVTKCGEDREGLQIWKGEKQNVVPVVYPQYYPSDWSVEEVAEKIIEVVDEATQSIPSLDFPDKLDWEDVKYKVYPCAGNRKATSRYINSEVCDDVHEYVRYFVDAEHSVAVTPEFLEILKITEGELFEAAEMNARGIYTVQSLEEKLFGRAFGDTPLMIIIETDENAFGAAGMFFSENLEKACDLFGTDEIVIIPSSIHEILCLPTDDAISFDDMKRMVREVNSSVVTGDEYFTEGVFTFKRGDFMFERVE